MSPTAFWHSGSAGTAAAAPFLYNRFECDSNNNAVSRDGEGGGKARKKRTRGEAKAAKRAQEKEERDGTPRRPPSLLLLLLLLLLLWSVLARVQRNRSDCSQA